MISDSLLNDLDEASNSFFGSLGNSGELLRNTIPSPINDKKRRFTKQKTEKEISGFIPYANNDIELGIGNMEPIRKRSRIQPRNGPLPASIFQDALRMSENKRNNRKDHLNNKLDDDEFEAVSMAISESVIDSKFKTDNLALAQAYVVSKTAMDLGVAAQLDHRQLKLYLNPPNAGDPLFDTSVEKRVEAVMRYINMNARIYSHGTCPKIIYKEIDPETGIVKAKIATKDVFLASHALQLSDMFIPVYCFDAADRIEDYEEVPANTLNEMDIFHVQPMKTQTPRAVIWRVVTRREPTPKNVKDHIHPSKYTGDYIICGWKCNILRLWLDGNWSAVVKSVTFSPIPKNLPGSATNDQVNEWYGVAHDEANCKEAYDEIVKYNADDPRFNNFMHNYLQIDCELNDGDECHLWRHVGSLIEEHGLKQIANKNQEAYNWIKWHHAHILRKPYERTEKSLCCKGREGVGKSMFFEVIKRLLGPEYVFTTSSAEDVLGDFNDSIIGKILIIFEEASSDAEQSKQLSGHWKRAITDSMVRLRRMYSPAEEHTNFMNFISISQHEDQVPWTFRRLFAVETTDSVRESNYYDALATIIYNENHPRKASPAVRAWAYQYLYRGFSDAELTVIKKTLVPQTPIYRRLLIKNLPTVEQWLYQQLREGINCNPPSNRRDKHGFFTCSLIGEAETYYNRVKEECSKVGMIIVDEEGGVTEDFKYNYIRLDGKFCGRFDMWPSSTDNPVPKELKRITPFVHFKELKNGLTDYSSYTFADEASLMRVTAKTWQDVAYYHAHLMEWDIRSKDWNTWVCIDDWYSKFSKKMTSTRHSAPQKTTFVNVISSMLSGTEKMKSIANTIETDNGMQAGVHVWVKESKLYWNLPTLKQSRINWAKIHLCDVNVFEIFD